MSEILYGLNSLLIGSLLLVSVAAAIEVDLDRPRRGQIKVDLKAMIGQALSAGDQLSVPADGASHPR